MWRVHKLQVLRDISLRFVRSTRVVVPQNLSSSALLLVTVNSHAHTHTHTHTYAYIQYARIYVCVCIFSSQNVVAGYSDTFFFISSYFFYFFLTSKRYIFLLFCACRELPLDHCSVFCLFFYGIFSLSFSLLSIGFRWAASLSLLLPWSKPKQRFLRQVPHRRSRRALLCAMFSRPLLLPTDIVDVVVVCFARWMDGCPHLYLIEQRA